MTDPRFPSYDRRSFLQATGVATATSAIGGVAAGDRGSLESGSGERESGPRRDELLVGITAGERVGTAAMRVQAAMPPSADVVHRNDTLGYLTVQFPGESRVSADSSTAEQLRRVPGVKYVETNGTSEVLEASPGGTIGGGDSDTAADGRTPDDPQFADQYAPQLVNAPEAWERTMGSDDVTIAIVNSGVESEHPDLTARFGAEEVKHFSDNDGDSMPSGGRDEYRGTAFAGLAAATIDDGTGIAGLSNSRLLSAAVGWPSERDDVTEASWAHIAEAVQWATDRGADLIVLAVAGGTYSKTLKHAVSYAIDNGTLPVCGVGDRSDDVDSVRYPAAHDECLAVSAIDETEAFWDGSNVGQLVDVTAPGVNVQTTVSGGYDRRSGTGLACSVTAGVAALGLAAHPEWGPTELRGRLKQTAVDLGLPENEQGAGRVDAATLLSGDGATDGNKAPIAKMLFSHPEPDVGQTVFLDGEASVDSDGDIVEYRWEHGGTEETGTIVETTVSEPGRYEVTLTVTDDDGATDSTTRALRVGDGDGTSPVARMEISDRHPGVGDTVTVDGSESTDPNGEIVEYRWEHGGTEETGETISLTPSEEGSYEVTLTVTDDDGATDTTSQTIDVGSNQAPTADMVISHLEPDLGETVYFNGKASIDADGEIVEYRWEHGGHEETGEIMETSVSEKGPYEVTLTVTDDDGATDSTTREIQVGGSEGNTPPTAKFRTNTTEPDVGEVVFFDAGNSRDPDGDIVEYRWEDGDGDSLTGQVVQAAGPRNRAYQVTLTVTDDDGATDSTTKIIYVGGKDDDNEAPTAAFTVSPSDPSGGETVTLDAGDSTDPDGDVVLYTWTDNLGNTEHGDVAELSAPEDGPWEITLEIMDDAGATDVVSKDVLGSSSRAIAYAGPKHVQTVENRLNGYLDSERFTYTTTLSDPAQVTVSLDGPDDADFDLFVTTDGRTPKTYDFDRQSVTQDSHETIVLEDVDPGQELGILVDVWSGMGLYTATVEELE